MGEMADEIYDQIMDSEWGFFRPRREREPRCRKCGLYLRWHETPQGWRLVNPDNTVHVCGVVADVDEFGVVE